MEHIDKIEEYAGEIQGLTEAVKVINDDLSDAVPFKDQHRRLAVQILLERQDALIDDILNEIVTIRKERQTVEKGGISTANVGRLTDFSIMI